MVRRPRGNRGGRGRRKKRPDEGRTLQETAERPRAQPTDGVSRRRAPTMVPVTTKVLAGRLTRGADSRNAAQGRKRLPFAPFACLRDGEAPSEAPSSVGSETRVEGTSDRSTALLPGICPLIPSLLPLLLFRAQSPLPFRCFRSPPFLDSHLHPPSIDSPSSLVSFHILVFIFLSVFLFASLFHFHSLTFFSLLFNLLPSYLFFFG